MIEVTKAKIDVAKVDWDKGKGLLPAIIQDAGDGAVLMLGYMNREALAETLASRRVTFWSRSKRRLWTKGESSGNFLALRAVAVDCDGDTLLILAEPSGPACHTGSRTFWGDNAPHAAGESLGFLAKLERIIQPRTARRPQGTSTSNFIAHWT